MSSEMLDPASELDNESASEFKQEGDKNICCGFPKQGYPAKTLDIGRMYEEGIVQ